VAGQGERTTTATFFFFFSGRVLQEGALVADFFFFCVSVADQLSRADGAGRLVGFFFFFFYVSDNLSPKVVGRCGPHGDRRYFLRM